MDSQSEIRISVIMPTTGRPSLKRAVDSVVSQLGPLDEMQVAGTGIDDRLLNLPSVNLVMLSKPGGNWGKTEREAGMSYATGTHLMFLDDDDSLMPNAITQVKSAIRRYPNRPLMFKAICETGLILYGVQQLKVGNFSSCQFVTPNIHDMLGHWTERYEGDFDFIVSTVEKYPDGALVWCDAIIAGAREFSTLGWTSGKFIPGAFRD